MTAFRFDPEVRESVWVPTCHNNCGDDAPVDIVRWANGDPVAIAPAKCRGCGHRFTPREQDEMEAAALAEVARA